jgi:hypothetical protein
MLTYADVCWRMQERKSRRAEIEKTRAEEEQKVGPPLELRAYTLTYPDVC